MRTLLCFILILGAYSSISGNAEIDLELSKEYNFFTVPITFGTNTKGDGGYKTFEIQIDTTTSETWVPSVLANISNVEKYNVLESTSSEELNRTIEINDEDGDVSGKSVCDALKVGPFQLDHFAFVQINTYDEDFADYSQGKLGLGLREDHGKNFSFLSTLEKYDLIEHRLFTIDPIQEKLIVGQVPSKYLSMPFSTCNTTETDDLDDDYRSGWVCELTHIFYNEENILFENGHGVNGRVIFDSAYQYISIPVSHLKYFKKEFMTPFLNETCKEVSENEGSDKEIYFICDNDEDKLDQVNVTFLIGGYGYIMKKDTLFAKKDGKLELLIRFTDENDNIWSLGVPFVYNHVMVYNMDEKSVGFYYGQKIDLSTNWTLWINGELPYQKRQKMIILIVFTSVLGIILISIVSYMIFKACRKPHSNENGPLVQYEEKK